MVTSSARQAEGRAVDADGLFLTRQARTHCRKAATLASEPQTLHKQRQSP